ncbi:hypothetical protein MDAP_000917 [Mitosporidium daphniae]
MNTMKALDAILLILLVNIMLRQTLDIKNLCLFIGDAFTPKIFDGQDRRIANQVINKIFSVSKTNFLNAEYAIGSEVYDKIMDTITQVSNLNPFDVYQKVQDLKPLPYHTDLRAFGNKTNSVVFFCGFTLHAMLCEIFKVASPDPKHEHLWKVLIYNSGDGVEYHPEYHVGPKIKYSPVVIYEGPPFLINEAWVEAAMNFGLYEKVVTNFYPRLLGAFDRSNATYDIFINPQRTGTCTFSSYHAYFRFKFGKPKYDEIFSVASLSGLQYFASGRFSDLVSEDYLSKHSLFFAFPAILLPFYKFVYQIANMFPFKILTQPIFLLQCNLNQAARKVLDSIPFLSKERREKIQSFNHEKLASYTSALNEIGKFHFLRCNVDLVDTMFRYLVEIGNDAFEMKEHVFFRDLKIAYDQFQIVKKKNIFDAVSTHIADNRGIRASFSGPNWTSFNLGPLDKVSANERFYCNLPNFEYKDGDYDPQNLTEFSNSIFHFLNNEIAYQPCFIGKEIPLISYLDSMTFRVMPVIKNCTSSDVDKMGFLYTFFIKIWRLLNYENHLFMYQKALILFEILKTYKEIYIRHLKASLNNDENNFKFIKDQIFEKLSPSFSYSDEIDLLQRILPKSEKYISFSHYDGKITSDLVAILFKDNSYPPNPGAMGKFFNVDMIKSKIHYASEYGYDRDHFKRMAYILTVIATPISIENSNNTVLPKTFLLDRHYYNFLHMLCKVSRRPDGDALVLSPISRLNFKLTIAINRYFHLKTDGYNNDKEISSLSFKEQRPLKLMTLSQKFSSAFYFLKYLQENNSFILSDAGMQLLYTFLLKTSTYNDDNSQKALSPVIRYFLFRKDKIRKEISTDKDDIQKLRLLANYHIILNRLMSIEKRDLDIGDLEHVFVGEYQPIFAFLKLNTLILGKKFSNLSNSHGFYLSVISNFELIKSFFLKEEIQYVLRMYYDHWKFASSKSGCAAQTEKGIQNLVNGNFLIDGERIKLPRLPFPRNHLWKRMNITEKRNDKLEFTLHRCRSSNSIIFNFRYNSMHLALTENHAFLLKKDEIEAKLVSEDFKLCHKKPNIQVSFNSKMVGSDDSIIAFQTPYQIWWSHTVYLFDSHGFEYAVIYNGNNLVLKNSSKFVGNVSSALPCSFDINSFCSFSSVSQSLLDAFLTRGVLFNFVLYSYIFTLESEAQSFYFFDSYHGAVKDFYAIKEGSDLYFIVIKGEKFKIHSPAGIEGNFLVSSNLPFLFVSIENSFHIIIPVPLSKPGDSYSFTFLNATCRDLNFNIQGHRREVDFAITYWLVFLKYYDRAMEYVSLYTSISFELTAVESLILRNILEIKYRDLEYLVIEAWANHFLGEHEIFFKGFLDEANRIEKITNISNLIPVIPFNYKRSLFSFLPNIGEDKYLWAYSKKLQIGSSIGESAELRPDIRGLKKDIEDAHDKLPRNNFPKIEPVHWSRFQYFKFLSYLSFLYDLAGSCKDLPDFTSRLNAHYLNSIRFYLEMDNYRGEYKIVCLFHVIFMVFNRLPHKEKLSTFFAKLQKRSFPYELLDIYDRSVELKSFIPYEGSIKITKILPSPPADYENLFNITVQKNALSSDVFKANASFTFFSDAASLEQKLKSIVTTDELLYGFPLRALKDPRLLAQILLCGSVDELRVFFTVSAEKTPQLLDLLWSHFITFFYCKSSFLQKNTFCQAWLKEKEASTQQAEDMPGQKLPVTLQDKVFILIEFFTKYPLYEEQRTIMSTILDKMMHERSYVVQQGMAGGKTTRFGPAAAIIATSILRKLPIFIFPNSILNQNILQLQQWLFDFFGKSVFEFKVERSPYGYSESYLRYLYYRLAMAHHRGDAFVSSINSIQCLLNAIKELYLQNTQASRRSFAWVVRILYFIKYYSIFVLDEADEIMDASILYNFETKERDEKDWNVINLLIECFLYLRDKKEFESQTGEKITIFEIKEPLTPSTVGPFKQILNKELNDILSKASNETRAFIVDNLFVNCWEKIRNVGYGASMESPFPYPIPYSMANTPREGSSFGNKLFIIAISLKFYLETEMKDLSEPPLFFTKENIYSILELFDYDPEEIMQRTPKLSHLELFNYLRDRIYENDENLKTFLRDVVIEGIKTSPHQIVSSAIEFILSCTQVLAYSGTLYNWKNFKVIPNVDIDVNQSSVIERRIHNSFAFPPRPCYTKNYPEIYDYATPIKSLGIAMRKDHQFDALMAFILKFNTTALFDVGAILKDYSNSKIAQDILASKKYKCVVYYDDKQNVIVYQMDTGRVGRDLPVEGQFEFLETKYGLKNEDIFLYLDQPHCFGTNVDVKNPSAVCVVTFSTLVYTKSFYQALLRARKLLNGISHENPLTPPNDSRHQIRFFVSSFLKYDQAMFSTLSEDERETLLSKMTLFPKNITADKKAALQKIFTSAHLNQLRRDRKERNLLPWQVFFAKLLMIFWSPAYSADSSIPNWDGILSIKDKESIGQLKWIFFSESMPKQEIIKFFEASEVGKRFFPNFNISSIPSGSNTPTLDRETVVQSTQEKESVQEHEQIRENMEDTNVFPVSPSPFGISDAKVNILRVRFTKDFAKTVSDRLSLNDTYTKYPVFVDAVDGKKLFATMNDVSEKLGDVSHFFFSPALINIYDLEEFDFEDMLHYFAYSGSAVGLMDLLDSSTRLRNLIFSFIAAHEPILQQWIYFARKFKNPSSLRALRRIKGEFKDSTKYNFTNLAIKTSISQGKLHLKICAKDSKNPFDLDHRDKTFKRIKVENDEEA